MASNAPANANSECVGPTSNQAGKASSCEGCPNQGACSSGAFSSPEAIAKAAMEAETLQTNLRPVSHTILILSGKGGVGKSTVAAQLSQTLAYAGYAVGLLDVDLCGPSAPRMVLGEDCYKQTISNDGSGAWTPVYTGPNQNLAVMSISFLLQDPDQAVVWRGPRKNALIQQFLTMTDWSGDTAGLDYLIIDTPPGTSDEHISTVQFLQKAQAVSGAIVVTTPEEVSLADVRKELSFCQKTKVPVLGIIENMGTLQTSVRQLKFMGKDGEDCTSSIMEKLRTTCPEVLECMVKMDVFSTAKGSSPLPTATAVNGGSPGVMQMAAKYNVPYWGSLPLDPDLLQACENGQCFVEKFPSSPTTRILQQFRDLITTKLPVEMEQS